MSTVTPKPALLPAIECTSRWMENDGHASESHPDDQTCPGPVQEIPLSRYPLMRMGNDTHQPQKVEVQLYRPHEGVPWVCLGIPTGLEVELTREEAVRIAQTLIETACVPDVEIPSDDARFISAKEAAAALGVGPDTVYGLTADGILEHRFIGKGTRLCRLTRRSVETLVKRRTAGAS